MEKNKITPSFDRVLFLENYKGMEDLARETIASFLFSLSNLVLAIEESIQSKNPSALEISAHTFKGAVSNFYAEPTRLLAFQLEQMGRSQIMTDADKVFSELKVAIERLSADLSILLVEKDAT